MASKRFVVPLVVLRFDPNTRLSVPPTAFATDEATVGGRVETDVPCESGVDDALVGIALRPEVGGERFPRLNSSLVVTGGIPARDRRWRRGRLVHGLGFDRCGAT